MPTFDESEHPSSPAPGWEPDPLHLPLAVPPPRRAPAPDPAVGRRDDEPDEPERTRVITIDLC